MVVVQCRQRRQRVAKARGHRGWWIPAALFSLSAVGLLGCSGGDPGPPRAAVSGLVTIDGQPLEEGTLNFIPTGDTVGPSASATITQGKYELPALQGAVVGRNRVEIQGFRKTGKQIDAGPPNPPGTMIDEILPLVPAQFNTRSELATDIAAGANPDLNFDLKSR